jgi:hypothetical protein
MPYTPGLAALNIATPQPPLTLQNVMGLASLANGGGPGGNGAPFAGGLSGLYRGATLPLNFLGGAGGAGNPPPNMGANGLSDLERYRVALGMTESSGDYSREGPMTRHGRALGRYQVMPFNVGPWTQRWYGRRLTPQEFLASPEAQDAVFRGQFGSYLNRYGNHRDAASMWFSGHPYSIGRARTDAIPGTYRGLTGEEYVNRFERFLQGLR